MGHGALVWCAGIGGLWCSLSALAFLLAALISPHWASTTEPLVLDDPYPYYADMEYPLHLRHRPSNLFLQQPHPLPDQTSAFDYQMLQASTSRDHMASSTSLDGQKFSQASIANPLPFDLLDGRTALHSTHNNQTSIPASFDDQKSLPLTQKPHISFGGSKDLENSLVYRSRTERRIPHRSALPRFHFSLVSPFEMNKITHLWNIRNNLQSKTNNVHFKRDVNDNDHSSLKVTENDFSADENTYVVVEENSDIVYMGVNISEWINPFSHKSRFQKKKLNSRERNGKESGVFSFHSGVDETKRSDVHYNVAAASSYPSSPPISAHLGPQHKLAPVFEGLAPGRSIPLKRPENAPPQIYYPAENPSQIFHYEDGGPSQTYPTQQKTWLPSADAGNWPQPAPTNAKVGVQNTRFSKPAAHDNIGTTASQKTWSGNLASDEVADLYQDDHDSHERPDDLASISTAAFRLGLWSVCPSVNISSINLVLLAPRCAPISYVTARASERTWGLPGPTPLTLTVIARIRISTPFLLCSCVLLVLGAVLAMAGRCRHHQAALLATLLFTLAGLSTGVAVVWFLSVITEEFAGAAHQGTAWSSHYSYSYGWSLLSAAASAGASFLAALLTGHAHMAQYTPWQHDKLAPGNSEEENIGRSLMMKCRSESHISSGRSFTSDTIRTYLTNDSRRQLQSQSISQGCFIGTTSSQSINDSSSLVDLTKPVSDDALHEHETQETTMDVVTRPHCSRHSTPSRTTQFRSLRTKSLSHTPEYVNAEDLQINRNDSMDLETSGILPLKSKIELIRQSSVQLSALPETSPSTNKEEDTEDYDESSSKELDSPSPPSAADSTPTPVMVSELPSPSLFPSRTLPRRMFTGPLHLPTTNSFNEDNSSSSAEQDSTFLSHSFTDVEPPDLFNTNKKPTVSYSNTLPHGGKHVTVYSKKGNVRAATLTDSSSHHLTHV